MSMGLGAMSASSGATAIKFVDQNGTPYTGVKYIIEHEEHVAEGVIGADGLIPTGDFFGKEVILKVYNYPDEPDRYDRFSVNVGGLESIDTIKGIQQRLANLNFYIGAFEGVLDESTTNAIKSFQTENQLEPTGLIDETTKSLLGSLTGQ